MMYSEVVSARTLWFVIWVRQVLLAQQVKPLQLITTHLCSLSSESQSRSSSFKVGPLFENVASKFTWALLSCHIDTKSWISLFAPSWIAPTPSRVINDGPTGPRFAQFINSTIVLVLMTTTLSFLNISSLNFAIAPWEHQLTKCTYSAQVKCWNIRARSLILCSEHHFL